MSEFLPYDFYSSIICYRTKTGKPKRKLGEKNNQNQDGLHQQHEGQVTLKNLHQRGILDQAQGGTPERGGSLFPACRPGSDIAPLAGMDHRVDQKKAG